jgi:DNA polymerase-3 subunit epsilon
MRQIVLDTETTGLEASLGHRIIEIGCVELVNRRVSGNTFHRYINPQRAVDAGALEVHGIDDDFLAMQPAFADVASDFLDFVRGAELVIHNAEFDVAFINQEFHLLEDSPPSIESSCGILDTLALARRLHPGQRNNLDALARRYHVDTSKRELHGALLDARILAEVYLLMTGGQASLLPDLEEARKAGAQAAVAPLDRRGLALKVVRASKAELASHEQLLERIRAASGGIALWDESA